MAGPPLLVLGASAGGVEALVNLVAGLPAGLPATVLVTLHTGERTRSTLPRILARSGPLPAEHATHGARVRAGHIAVAPPDRHLLVRDETLLLSAGPKVNRHRPAVDVMFTAAAQARGPRVVAAVLSGVLDDGAFGAAIVDREGGCVVVQDPAEARFGAMPEAALTAVPSARTAPAKELGPLLAMLVETLPEEEMDDRADRYDERARPEGAAAPGRFDPGDGPYMAESADPGFLRPDESHPTRMVCPECNGAIARIDLPHLSYYRCHVGHQYAPRSLEAAQRETAEAKLWAAVAALEEHAAMAGHLAETQAAGDGQQDYGAAAAYSAELAGVVRQQLRRRPT